jgi:SAM-dependent methyltransferase
MQLSEQDKDFSHNREFYDDFWGSRIRRRYTYANQGKLRRFRRLLNRRSGELPTNARIFEQGFGMGMMLECFSKGSAITGVELSKSSVTAADKALRKKGFSNVDLRVCHAGTPYPAEWLQKADFAISSHVLEHLKQPDQGLSQLITMVKTGGRVCIMVPINEEIGQDVHHFSYFTTESIQRLARQLGLSVIDVHECDYLWNIGVPIARRLQQEGGIKASLYSKVFNAAFGFLPAWVLSVADAALRKLGWRPCQCFLWCEKL